MDCSGTRAQAEKGAPPPGASARATPAGTGGVGRAGARSSLYACAAREVAVETAGRVAERPQAWIDCDGR